MPPCPYCDLPNPDQAAVCSGCGNRLFGPTAPPALLPDPMVEPIHTPPKPPPDSKPLPACPALTVGGKSSGVISENSLTHDGGAGSAPMTIRDLPPAWSTHDGIVPAATIPPHPGIAGHPMSDPALQPQPLSAAGTESGEGTVPPPTTPAVRPRLVVLRGLKIGAEFPIYEGRNTLGHFAEKPVDIDLMNQESVEQIWCSRQHAVITFDKGIVAVEDLNSLNGTWLNGVLVPRGQRRQLKPGDVLQVGTVQMRLEMA